MFAIRGWNGRLAVFIDMVVIQQSQDVAPQDEALVHEAVSNQEMPAQRPLSSSRASSQRPSAVQGLLNHVVAPPASSGDLAAGEAGRIRGASTSGDEKNSKRLGSLRGTVRRKAARYASLSNTKSLVMNRRVLVRRAVNCGYVCFTWNMHANPGGHVDIERQRHDLFFGSQWQYPTTGGCAEDHREFAAFESSS
jgi:hypothetical protein